MGSKPRVALGIDVGGTGVKGAPVDLRKGTFAEKRLRIPTPRPATPEAVCDTIAEVVGGFGLPDDAPVGVTIPGPVKKGVVQMAVNLDPSWAGFDAQSHLERLLQRPVHVVNDADAAGVGEDAYGAAADQDGIVVVTTLGTGIGTALICDGVLFPNSELGHIEVGGFDAETRAANSVREREQLSWEEWAQRLQVYYAALEFLMSPDLFVVGGGVSKDADQFLPLLDLKTPVVPATLRNKAGIVGAAHLARRHHRH